MGAARGTHAADLYRILRRAAQTAYSGASCRIAACVAVCGKQMGDVAGLANNKFAAGLGSIFAKLPRIEG